MATAQVEAVSPSRFYVSTASIPFKLAGTWSGVPKQEATVRFRAATGTPFRTEHGAPIDILELPCVLNDKGEAEGTLPPGRVAEAATSWVDLQLGAGEPVPSGSPLGIFNFQHELPAPAELDGQRGYAESIAISGDTLIIGAWEAETLLGATGAAYVYVRSAGTWTLQQRLEPSDGLDHDKFGWTVAIDGDLAAVSAIQPSTPQDAGGAVYVFSRSGSVWTEEKKLVVPNAPQGHTFGWSLALDGETLAAGAGGQSDTTGPAGVRVYVRAGGAWPLQQRLTAANGSTHLGACLALEANTLVAGAPFSTTQGSNAGAVHVFVRSGSTWTEQDELLASDGGPSALFGRAVDISGDRVVVGSALDPKRVYVFSRWMSLWTEEQIVFAQAPGADGQFGRSVAIEGGRIAAGATSTQSGLVNAGLVYVFERIVGTWSLVQVVQASDRETGDRFGHAVALDAETLVVAAWTHRHVDPGPDGSVYVH